jgi:hypothetical protein
MERRHDEGEKWRRLELGARVKEGTRKLGRVGRRCGGVWGSLGVYIGVRGVSGR